MRIIGGKARGTKLYTLEGNNTRPTLDRVRESLFNIIQKEVPDCTFLDLFSGSGAVGLEAISRGAKKAILCDNQKQAVEVIKKNVEKTHLENEAQVYHMSFENLLENEINEKIDIIYIDPPYKTNFVSKAIKLILKKNLIGGDSIIVIETDEEERIKKEIEELSIEIVDQRKYGRAHLIFLKKK